MDEAKSRNAATGPFFGAEVGRNLFWLDAADCYVWFNLESGRKVQVHYLRRAARIVVDRQVFSDDRVAWYWSDVATHPTREVQRSIHFMGAAGWKKGFIELACVVYEWLPGRSEDEVLQHLVTEPWADVGVAHDVDPKGIPLYPDLGDVARSLAAAAKAVRDQMLPGLGDIRKTKDPFVFIPQGVRISVVRYGRDVRFSVRRGDTIIDHVYDEREVTAGPSGLWNILLAIVNSSLQEDFAKLEDIDKPHQSRATGESKRA